MAAAQERDDPLGWSGSTRGGVHIGRVLAVDDGCVGYEANDGAARVEATALEPMDDDRRAAIVEELRRARKITESDAAFARIVGAGVETERARSIVWLAWSLPHDAPRPDGKLEPVEALDALAPIARALDVAHARGMVHGSIEKNSVIGDRLLGFGRAVLFGARGDRPRCAPPFAAPEQIDPALGPIGAWTDVFAVALLFVGAIVGAPALGGDTTTYVDRLFDRGRRPTARALGVGVSGSIDALLARALAVDPRARPSRMSELWSPLTQAVRAAPSTFDLTRRSLPAPKNEERSERRTRRTTQIERYAIGGAIAVGVGVGFLEHAIRSRKQADFASTSASASGPASAFVSASASAPAPAPTPAPSSSPRPVLAEMVSIDDGGPPLLVDRTEVTVADYRKCIRAGACTATRERSISYDASDPYRKWFLCNLFVEGRERHPINCVTFRQANAYCAWAGGRLPTAKEWTRAVGGEHARFPWGKEPPTCARVVFARYGPEQWGCREDPVGTAPVDAHPATANAFGVVDLAGNVWEWTSERVEGGKAILRGGGWDSSEKMLEASATLEQAIYNGEVNVGVRCVK